jgi:hypothetical protein
MAKGRVVNKRTKRYVVPRDGNSRPSSDDRNRDVRQDRPPKERCSPRSGEGEDDGHTHGSDRRGCGVTAQSVGRPGRVTYWDAPGLRAGR